MNFQNVSSCPSTWLFEFLVPQFLYVTFGKLHEYQPHQKGMLQCPPYIHEGSQHCFHPHLALLSMDKHVINQGMFRITFVSTPPPTLLGLFYFCTTRSFEQLVAQNPSHKCNPFTTNLNNTTQGFNLGQHMFINDLKGFQFAFG
jgi:hypothetical protein